MAMAASSSTAPVPYRVNNVQEFLLKGSACVLYVIQLILMLTLVGEVGTEVIGLVGDILYIVWFWLLGVNYFGGNSHSKLMTLVTNSVLETVPFVNGIYPGFCVEVWRLVAIMKKEDEEKHALRQKKIDKAEAAQAQQRARAVAIRAQRIAANDAEAAAEAQAA
ncbi:MAG: hypothetical protein JWO84_329 [Parcubacteria group bacterium]|nr:hypothetical protein [Parcubacteria group bacterium]